MNRKLGLLAGATLLAATALAGLPAKADVVLGQQNWSFSGVDNLVLSPVVPSGNQPQNIQCVICGENQPQQSSTFGYTDFHNTGQPNQDLKYFSTNISGGGDPGADTVGVAYSGDFLRAYLLANGGNLEFSIGIDMNDSNGTQVLESFFLLNLTQHKVLSVYSLNPNEGTPLPAINDGTGFPDYTLTGFNISVIPDVNGESDLRAGDQLLFFARLSNANDGPDSFFLVPTQVAVPGPVVGAGLPGLLAACGALVMFARRRRNRLA